jgi:hypothetical protein
MQKAAHCAAFLLLRWGLQLCLGEMADTDLDARGHWHDGAARRKSGL